MNENAAIGTSATAPVVNARDCMNSADHASSPPPKTIAIVPMTFSLAMRPVTTVDAACQLAKPSGANSHANALPKYARNE